jgi:hypothetical protein
MFRHGRRKRSRRQTLAHSRADDDVDDPNFAEHVWLPLTIMGLIVLAISSVVGAASTLLGTVFRGGYIVACGILFVLTTLFLGGQARTSIRDARLNAHRCRQQTVGQAIRQVWLYPVIGVCAYAPSVIVPALAFRAAWLGYLLILIEAITLAYGVYTFIRWWSLARPPLP